ncbi:hypothetical protein YC2023_083419 [Brassica napus]
MSWVPSASDVKLLMTCLCNNILDGLLCDAMPKRGVKIVECACVIELPELNGRDKLGETPLFILKPSENNVVYDSGNKDPVSDQQFEAPHDITGGERYRMTVCRYSEGCVEAIAMNACREQLIKCLSEELKERYCLEWWIKLLSAHGIDNYARVMYVMVRTGVRSESIIASLTHYSRESLKGFVD